MTISRSKLTTALFASVLWTAASASAAPDAPAKPKAGAAAAPAAPDPQAVAAAMERAGAVGENHKRLESMVGEWATQTRLWMDPSQPPMSTAGSNSNHLIMGGRFLESSYKGDMMGQVFEGQGLLGYDNLAGKYVGTWSDTMGTGIFYESGTYDAATKTMTMRGEMPNPVAPSTMVKIRTATRFVGPDTYVFEWYETYPGAKEAKSVEVTYTRKK